MRYILAKRQASTLASFASSNVVVAFDYDGTLAAISRDPHRARLHARTRRLLIAVAQRYPCVVISGRNRHDLKTRLENIPIWNVFGNHGLEPWSQTPVYAKQVQEWIQHLKRHLRVRPGLVVEDKTYSVAIHYRRVAEKESALKDINDAILGLRGSRALGGRQAVNLVPRHAPNKGTALERARRLLACDYAIYVGDDDTDEDAFRAGPPERLLSIRVGATADSAARYCLKTQSEIDRLLKALVQLRIRGDVNVPGARGCLSAATPRRASARRASSA
jgi:trehalose 6-phosphate phosphatase